ncbi:MAG: DUF2059 domain-containing protein [Rhizobiaceae bacterium]|nr:DUF2059 domain-containing protein [Rhizobiaceae bacterium]
MKFTNAVLFAVRYATIVAVTLLGTVYNASAQEITPEHTQAAKAAMIATGATSRLDGILPEIASFTKAGLIANRPDIEAEISSIVDETAISLAARRGVLEDEVAAIYTQIFTQAELESISGFFKSEAGIKFLNLTPSVFRQVDEVSKVWRTGITRDMARTVNEKMKEQGLQ